VPDPPREQSYRAVFDRRMRASTAAAAVARALAES